MIDIEKLSAQYREELLGNVVPFWLNRSQDRECGGYFTCLTREGDVFDTDKFVWLQCRQVWWFAYIYNKIEKRQEWLDCAVQGAEFLRRYGHDGSLNWYFSLTREGKPLICPYNIFSYTFAAMAFGQLSLATGNEEYADIARKTYDLILQRFDNPKSVWNKEVSGGRSLKGFGLPMIMCNLTLEIEHLIDSEALSSTVEICLNEIFNVFWRPELGIIVENVNRDGTLSDSFEGRLLNPGHAIEAMWFVMDLGSRFGHPEWISNAVEIAIRMYDIGWDSKYGGIYYFIDRCGYPPQQLEWDQKLWWVHLETLICMLKGYALTGSKECLERFEQVHDYSWSHFKDPEYPEWYGYLNRQGEVLLPLKGGKWKGCFHVPRALYQCWKTLEKLER
ncbi:MAG: AGE family epimerase/isomerase [Tannerella sp.]|jgi:N-acylglucosamine 2-epimerase|nr:AGE family epimerase/isomerase [Tannerella sp.]